MAQLIACPGCQTVYKLPDNPQRKTVKVKCQKCNRVFVVTQAPATSTGARADKMPAPELAPNPTSISSATIQSAKAPVRKWRVPIVLILVGGLLFIGLGTAGALVGGYFLFIHNRTEATAIVQNQQSDTDGQIIDTNKGKKNDRVKPDSDPKEKKNAGDPKEKNVDPLPTPSEKKIDPYPKEQKEQKLAPDSKEKKHAIGACFEFPADRVVSAEGRRKAIDYLLSLSADKEMSRAVDVVCSPKLLRQAIALKTAAKMLNIDGMDDDWEAVPVALEDPRDNVQVFDKSKPADEPSPGMDLAEISCVCTESDLYLRFKTFARPQVEDTYYNLQFYRDGVLIGSVGVIKEQVFVQLFKNDKVDKVDVPPAGKFEVKIKDVVEARIARSVLPSLPPVFTALAVTYNGKQNRVNFSAQFKVKPAESAAATTAAYLLARYAEKTDLSRAGLVPLAVCLTETVIYENVEAAARERVIEDGLAMIAASRETPRPLADLPFEPVLAWSNRAMMWGGLMGPHLDKRGLISTEAYEFMCLEPRILHEVRQHLYEMGIGKKDAPMDTAAAIDKWATAKNRYRWKLNVLEEWTRTQSRKDFWERIYKEALEDVKAGRDKICTLNGSQIDFTMVMSPNLDWRLYRKNGYFFGPCGEVAVMSMLAYKSLGIPDTCFAWRFGKEDAQVHTFAGYYDHTAKVWRSPQSPPDSLKPMGASVLLWTMPPLTDRLPAYVKTDVGGGTELYISAQNPYLPMSIQEMRKKLTEGLDPGVYAKLVYAQVETGR